MLVVSYYRNIRGLALVRVGFHTRFFCWGSGGEQSIIGNEGVNRMLPRVNSLKFSSSEVDSGGF